MPKKTLFIDLVLIIGFLILSRLVPHWPNFTALGALSLLVPLWLKGSNRFMMITSMIALVISDFLIGFHSTMAFTYGAVLLTSIVSHFYLTEAQLKGFKLVQWAVLSSIIFFLVTNLGAWLVLDMYTKDLHGLLFSYKNGLPFWGFDGLGTLFYSSLAILVRNYCHTKVVYTQIL